MATTTPTTPKKPTKKQVLLSMLTLPLTEDQKNYVNHELDLLEGKATASSKKSTALKAENSALGKAILAKMVADRYRLFTIAELVKEVPACEGLSNQKIAAVLRPMVGVSVERLTEKGKSYYRWLRPEKQ